MARLAAIEKGLYYPTPLSRIEDIAAGIKMPENPGFIRIFDPCCGEGKAVNRLGELLKAQSPACKVETWGVEISQDRAAKARKVLDRVINAPFEMAGYYPSKLKRPVSILFVNPPYDWDVIREEGTRATRMEQEFLDIINETWYAPSVILALVIPTRVWDRTFCYSLAKYWENVSVHRFPDEEGPGGFEMFKQVVVMATARKVVLKYPDNATRETYQSLLTSRGTSWYDRDRYKLDDTKIAALPAYSAAELEPPIAARSARLSRRGYTVEEIEKACLDGEFLDTISDVIYPNAVEMEAPLLTPTTGQIAMLVAAGMLGTIAAGGKVFKGAVVKSKELISETKETKKSERVYKDRYTTHLTVIDPFGLKHVSDAEEVIDFLKEHADTLRDNIIKRFVAYGEDPKPWEMRLLATLSLEKQLPGAEPGLRPDQKVKAIAMSRSVDRYGIGFLIADMGYGKSMTVLGTAFIRDAWPCLVTCPPHLVEPWQEEAESCVPGLKAVIVESMSELDAAIRQYERQAKKSKTRPRLLVIIANSKAKLSSGWKGCYTEALKLPKGFDQSKERQQALLRYQGLRLTYQHGLASAVARAKKLADQHPDGSRLGKLYRRLHRSLSRLNVGSVPPKGSDELRSAMRKAREAFKTSGVKEIRCPTCGEPLVDGVTIKDRDALDKKPHFCPRDRLIWDQYAEEWVGGKCEAPVHTHYRRWNRWPLADYVCRQHPDFFRLYIADEVHKTKSKTADVSWAFHKLSNILPTVALTGTIFGGSSSSLFYLLFRASGQVRREFSFKDVTRWVTRFGVNQYTHRTTEIEVGANRGRVRQTTNVSEKPGISPGIIKYMLPMAAFASIPDLGVVMPGYSDEFVTLGFERDAFESHIKGVEARTWSILINNYPRWLSAWLQWNLARPNSAFRDETIYLPGYEEAIEEKRFDDAEALKWELKGQIGEEHPLLPKERWLASIISSEISAGRKPIIYCRQTGTRDIQNRLQEVLMGVGVEATILRSNTVSARNRPEWLKKTPIQCLICNPRLVETGMNLHHYNFCSIVFYEIEYSLYTLWQAMSRVWRPGQKQNVRVWFSEYGDTMESKAYNIMGQKLSAGKALMGQEVTGALVEDSDELQMAVYNAVRQ